MRQNQSLPPTPPQGLARALAVERLRNERLLSLLRLIGVTLFLVIVIWQEVLKPTPRERSYPGLLAGYWVLSVALFASGCLSARLTRLSSLAVPWLDMPLVFLIQLGRMEGSTDPRAVANFTLGLYFCFIMLAAMTLRGWQLLLAAAVAIVLEQLLQHWAGESALGEIGGVLLIGLAAGVCDYARRRRVEMVNQVCAEQLLRERLERYFSPQVAQLIQQQADHLASGQSGEATVLFADLRGFTTLSEQLGSARIVALLNEFHTRMVEAVFACGGTLDKYMGDGLMAYFGAPLPQPDHAQRAVQCALAMQEQLAEFNAQRLTRGEPPLRMGIGLHSGPVVVGSIGAPHRREFTVVGDTVNLAARLEQVSKLFEEGIILSDETRQRSAESFAFKDLDLVSVRGRTAPVRIYTPLALKAHRLRP